jgi:hypothetical protein
MKLRTIISISLLFILCSASERYQDEEIEFVCHKMHKATNTCHFNFIINGAKYRHVDMGCKFTNKKDDLIEKVKAGTVALARDWKIECPEPKEKKDSEF